MRARPIFGGGRPPVPGPGAGEAELRAYFAAWRRWTAERFEAGYDDRIAVAEQEPGHADALARADALGDA